MISQAVGEGFELQLPRDWVTKYGPALKMGLLVMKMLSNIASVGATSVRAMRILGVAPVHIMILEWAYPFAIHTENSDLHP